MINKSILKITPYQPGKPIEELSRELGLKDIIKLASNENPLGPSPKAKKAIINAANKINRYPEGTCFYLRSLLSKKLKVKTQNLIFGNGSDEIIDIIVKAFCSPGDEILTSDTTFLEYKIIAQQNGRNVRCVGLKNLKYDLVKIKNSITARTKLIFIANPNNPTGTYVDKKEICEFLKSLPDRVIVVLDEAYIEFAKVKDFPQSLSYLNEGKNIIILRTFSKVYGLAGLRIGYAIANDEFIRYMERVRQPFNVNSLAQVAATAALGDEVFLKKYIRLVDKGKKYIYKQLRTLKIEYVASATNFILIDLKQDVTRIFKSMLKKGVIVRDLKQYGLNNYIRVTIGTDRENRKFIKALKESLK